MHCLLHIPCYNSTLSQIFSESPFEFQALEVALEAICSYLDARTTDLETAAYPALDELTSKVTTNFLFVHSFAALV